MTAQTEIDDADNDEETRIMKALALTPEHRECGEPKFDGCFCHPPLPHCRADGYPWPCDVARIRSVLSGTPL